VVVGILVLALAQSVPFLWRRRAPGLVLALAATSLAIRAGGGLRVTSAEAAVLVAAYGCGDFGAPVLRTAARAAAVVSMVAAVVVLLMDPGYHREAAIFPALLAAAFGAGEAASVRREAAAADVRHAQDAERTRIARELHDVIAHDLSAIAVQAGAARVAGETQPSAPLEAVGVIERAARDALIELNHLVGMLRHDPDDRLDRAPQPTLANLPILVERARVAGLPVALRIEGQPRSLAAAAELTAYRIVQEGLTNAIRYADGAAARVDLCYGPAELTVTVEDEGRATDTPLTHGGGRGLAGLRERIDLLGGSIEAGVGPQGGYRLSACIPAGTS
jgi:signal transduction histidine kinase